MKIKQRHFIKSSEVKLLKDDIAKQYNTEFVLKLFPKKCRTEIILTEEGDTLYVVNNELVLWKSKEHGFIPVLTQVINNKVDLKTVVVDMGAVKFITLSRADIMRPGITMIDPSIKKGEIIKVVDETHHKPLAIGKAMFDAAEMKMKTSGKVIKNIHSIKKDNIWTFAKNFK